MRAAALPPAGLADDAYAQELADALSTSVELPQASGADACGGSGRRSVPYGAGSAAGWSPATPRVPSYGSGPAAKTLPASSAAVVGARLEDWYGQRNVSLGHVLRTRSTRRHHALRQPRLSTRRRRALRPPRRPPRCPRRTPAAATPTASTVSAPAPPSPRSRPRAPPATRKARGPAP